MESTEICEVSLVDDTGLLTDTLLGGSSWSRPVIFPSNASAGDLGTLSIPITIVQEPIESQHLVEGFLLSNGDLPGVDREIILSQDTHEEVVEVSQLDNGKTSETETLVNFSGNGYEICIQNEKQPSPVNIPAETSDELVQTVDNDVDPPDRTGGPQNCDTCGLSFASRKAFRKHIESHLHDKPFKCSQCSESFNYECNLNAHVSTHNVDNPYCIVCKKNFTRFASLRAHVLIHQCDDTLFCPDCLEEFSSQTLLEKHRLEHLAEPAAFNFYECNQCENTYGSQSALRDHLKIVHGVKFQKKVKKRKGSYVCDYCKKRFEKPSQLIRHKRIHTGERPFKCESCGKGFGQKGSLRIHMLKHSGDKPFKCTHCGSCFSQKGNLRAHVIRIHPELYNESRNFKCKLCVSAFHNAAKLSSHVDKFHGGSSQMPEAEAPNAMTRTDTSNKENEEKAVKSTEQVQFLRITAVPAKSPSVPPNRVDNAKPLKKSPELKDALSQTPRIEGFVVKGNSQEAAPKPLLVTLVKEDVIDFFVCPVCNELLSSEEERERHKKVHHNPASAVQISSLELMSTESPSDPLTLANVTKILVMEDGTLGLVKDNYVVQWQTEANSNSASNSPTTVPPESTTNEVQMMQTEKLYRCDKCDRSFAALSHWKAHCRAHKDDNLSLKTLPSKPQPSPAPVVTSPQDSKTCKVCEKSFSSHSSLKRHQEVHESSSSIYSCNLCPRQYKSRATFQKHLNTHAKAQSFRAKQAGAETPEKVDKGIEFQGDWNDLVQSLQPGQQYSFDIADGTSDSPGKRIEIRLVKSNPSRTEMMDSERVEKSVPVVSPADDEPVIINDSFSQNSVVKTGNGLSFGLNPPVDGEKPQRRKVFTCDQCVGEFNSLMELSIHKTTHLKMTSKICSICQKSFNSVVSYEKHVRSCTKSVVVNENVRAFKCKHCGHGFFNEREFKSHVSNNNVLTVCEVCSKAFKCKKAHELHVQEHYAIKGIYSCRICNAVFSTEEEMIEHAEVHPIDKQKGTKKKKSNFSRPATTKKLTEEERKLLSTVPPKSVSEKALLNAIIEVERQNVERFQNGVKNEIVESSEEVHPNKCPYCPKSFRKPSDLVRHVRIHTGERPYKCTVCNKTFSIKSTAYSHVKTHTKDRSYSCHLCHKEFACIGSLKVHMRLHTGSMPFSCEICHAKFRTSGHKKAHLANHLKGSSVSNKEKNQSRGKSDRRSKVVALKAATTNESTPTITVALSPAEDSQPLITTPEPSPLQHHPLIPPSAADEVAQAVQYMPSLGESIIYDDSVRDILGNGLVRLEDCASTDVLDLASLPGNCLSSVTNDKPAELKKFVCVYCLKGFETQESLATHTKTHGFLECPVCHQSFKCKTDLEVHTLVHELDQWSCNGCSLAFGDQNTFKKHKCSSDSLGLGGGVVNDLKDLTSSSLDLSLEVNDLFLFPSD